jgi:hypothetical protein
MTTESLVPLALVRHSYKENLGQRLAAAHPPHTFFAVTFTCCLTHFSPMQIMSFGLIGVISLLACG